jgi:ECF sigma factor
MARNLSIQIGQQLGSYEITALLGKGGMDQGIIQGIWICLGHRQQTWSPLEVATPPPEIHQNAPHVVELRFFAGLTVEETAEVLKISPDTVVRDWRLARVWLHGELKKGATA